MFACFKSFQNDDVGDLVEKIKGCIVAQYGVGAKVEESGSSTEAHKEPEDKAVVRTALCMLSYQARIVYSDEVRFTLPSGTGPHGNLDLMIGRRLDEEAERCVIVSSAPAPTYLDNVYLGETKVQNSQLAACRLYADNKSPEDLTGATCSICGTPISTGTIYSVFCQQSM